MKYMERILFYLSSAILLFLNKRSSDENLKLKQKIKNVEEVKNEIVDVVKKKNKQEKIASAPSPDRDDVHQWLQSLSERDSSDK